LAGLYDGTTVRQHDGTTVRQHDGTTARRHDGTRARGHEGVDVNNLFSIFYFSNFQSKSLATIVLQNAKTNTFTALKAQSK
jgi:hypothetical protein